MRALIASGSGRYADPWHPFPRTSPLIATALEGAGLAVEIDDDVDGAMTRLSGFDVLVVNAGDPWRGDAGETTAPAASIDGFAEALHRGIGVVALHCAVASLRDYPEWAAAIGAMWVPGLSMHPDASWTRIEGGTLEGAAIPSFELFDERYCRLQQIGRSVPVAHHSGLDHPEPAAWVRRSGAARIAVDVLGHDERSYDSVGHRDLLVALAQWTVSS